MGAWSAAAVGAQAGGTGGGLRLQPLTRPDTSACGCCINGGSDQTPRAPVCLGLLVEEPSTSPADRLGCSAELGCDAAVWEVQLQDDCILFGLVRAGVGGGFSFRGTPGAGVGVELLTLAALAYERQTGPPALGVRALLGGDVGGSPGSLVADCLDRSPQLLREFGVGAGPGVQERELFGSPGWSRVHRPTASSGASSVDGSPSFATSGGGGEISSASMR